MTRDTERESALWEIEESRLESRIVRLSVENARLRKALEEIERRGQRCQTWGVDTCLDHGRPQPYCDRCTARAALRDGRYTIEPVYVGTAGHLRRYKVVDANGKYIPGGLFKTLAEAEAYGEAHA